MVASVTAVGSGCGASGVSIRISASSSLLGCPVSVGSMMSLPMVFTAPGAACIRMWYLGVFLGLSPSLLVVMLSSVAIASAQGLIRIRALAGLLDVRMASVACLSISVLSPGDRFTHE